MANGKTDKGERMKCEGYMVITRDIAASRNFYTAVIGAQVELDIGGHVIFKEGFSLLYENDWKSFAGLRDADISYGHNTGQLVFEVDDIGRFQRHLEGFTSLRLLHPVKEHHWGRRAVRLYDPDGHVVEVGESMKVVVTRFLRQGLSPEEAAARSEFPLSFALACKAEMERPRSAEGDAEGDAQRHGSIE